MYIQPKSVLSQLLGAAWAILLIVALLWLAVQLLADVWIWLVGIAVVASLVRLGFLIHQLHRDDW